jgi:rhamnopyranosyl-N-acetylglucosaminyl-diphospho-decaprenol beta-1,3/1,4-galactofuranosyltransferase
VSAPTQVIAVTATFRRPVELTRLLESLATAAHPLAGLVVIDNADDPATRAAVTASSIPHLHRAPGANLGCGGGLALAERLALEHFPGLTHLWILDDDAVVFPETLTLLLQALEKQHADAAHPLSEDGEGRLAWFPGLLDPAKFRAVRQPQTQASFLAQCGPEPIPFSWSQGIALLVTRRVLDDLGPHRDDYWVRGEDLEFTLRITAQHRGVYVPAARVRHLPPVSSADPATERPKYLAMLQNLAYTALRLPHGRRILRTLPGNYLRFLRTYGFAPAAVLQAFQAFITGALQGRPAGAILRIPSQSHA